MDSPDRLPIVVQTSQCVSTFVLTGDRSDRGVSTSGDNLGDRNGDAISSYAAPSAAVEAAVAFVAANPATRYASVMTGEYRAEDPASLLAGLRGIAAFAQPGQVVVSLATQELARLALAADYGFGVIGTTSILNREVLPGRIERLFLVEHPSLPARSGRLRSPTDARRNTAFFGRRRALDELASLIDLSRLVTVYGITGIGKSALLHRFVADIADRFADGVVQIDLSLIDQPALVAPTLVRLLDAARLPGEDHVDSLIAFLEKRRFLLVLDNVEHVLPEVRRVLTPLLDACPELMVLVGSLRPLRLVGEARYRLEGLGSAVLTENWRAVQDSDAVALFIDRVQLLDPAYRLTEGDAAPTAEICRRLDGSPLAIELAAARTTTFSPRQILTRLDDRLLLLSDPSAARPERHSSLKATMDWADARLRGLAKRLLRRLSVFAGGFSADEAFEVCGEGGTPSEPFFAAFEELIETSLLTPIASNGHEKRFRLGETVRIHAAHGLRGSPYGRVVESRHRTWCAELCRQAASGLVGADQFVWLERLDAHLEDIRTAVEHHCAQGGDGALAISMLLSIHSYFFTRHYLLEGFKLAAKVADARNTQGLPELSRVQNLVSALARPLGDKDAAREYAIRSIAGARRQGNPSYVARARVSLASVYVDESRYARARRHLLGATVTFRRLGEEVPLARTLINLAGTEPYLKLHDEAEAHLVQAASLLDRYPDAVLRAYYEQNACNAALVAGRPREALRRAQAALVTFSLAQELNSVCSSLRNVAYALEALGELDLAARFVGAHRARVWQLDHPVSPAQSSAFQELSERLRRALGNPAYERLTFMGAEYSIEDLSEIAGRNTGN